MTGGIEVRGSNIYHRWGDTGRLNIHLLVGDTPYTLKDGDTGLFTVKKKKDDEAMVLQKEMADGVFTLLPEDTKGLRPGKYWYDMQITLSTGEVCTVAIGKYNLMGDVTTGVMEDEADTDSE
jgi:hypothetical protein